MRVCEYVKLIKMPAATITITHYWKQFKKYLNFKIKYNEENNDYDKN
jgi:hypothetical protein